MCWTQDGLSFQIKDAEKLCSEILPSHFRHSKYPSFIRQLNIYGFRKKHKNGKKIYYSHPCFKKDDKELMREITRNVPKKATCQRKSKKTDINNLESRVENLEKNMDCIVGYSEACCEVTPR